MRSLVSGVLGLFAVSGCTGTVSVFDARDAARDAGTDTGTDGGTQNPFLPRQPNTSCSVTGTAGPGDYTTENAFPNLSFDRPLWVGFAGGDASTVFVAEQGGTIFAFDNDAGAASRDTFLALSVYRNHNEEGLLGLAFHPDYATNGRFYVNYSSNVGCPAGFSRCSVISEYLRSGARRADSGSERRVLVVGQPHGNHNGGSMHFGSDGHLYISIGDGGSGNDPDNNGQDTATLLGNILRIDVDGRSGSLEYAIPAGNPFEDGAGGAREIYAWGLRNPWRMSEDRSTGALWIGDVGQGAFEEIDKITAPGNLGWRIREGFECRGGGDSCSSAGLVPPVHVYGRSLGRSVTGGLVYRGTTLPELVGQYLFADFVSGRVWRLQEAASASDPPDVEEIFQLANPSSFGETPTGEILITTFGGTVERLIRDGAAPAPSAPNLLSATGCFADTRAHELADGVIPYELNVPFWSDGAEKERFIALPGTAGATPSPQAFYEFPVGTALIKTFRIDVPAGTGTDGGSTRRIETRIFGRTSEGWRGHSYRWNDAQTDATLVDTTLELDLTTAAGTVRWTYPSSAQCNECHTSAAGFVLGFRSHQLHRDVSYNGTTLSQLEVLNDAGVLDPPHALTGLTPLPALEDTSADVDARARAWLEVNCAMCHLPGGPTTVSMDLRVEQPLNMTATCNVSPSSGDLGLIDPFIVAPGEPDRSILLARVNRRGVNQMPPLASSEVDNDGVALLRSWIAQLSCP